LVAIVPLVQAHSLNVGTVRNGACHERCA